MNLSGVFVRSLDSALLRRYPPLVAYLEKLGETPLLEVPGPGNGARVFAKAEWLNPNGTVKDRVAFGMMYRLLERVTEADRASLHILEYTGGSLGVALAGLCSDLAIPLTLVVPSSTDTEVVRSLQDRGAEVLFSPAELAFWGVIETTRRLAAEHPTWRFLYQHENAANLWMHRETTGREILRQLPPGVPAGPCAWVASVGTGGTLIGTYAALAEALPHLQMFVANPAELTYGTEQPPNAQPRFLGSGGFGNGRKQPFVAPWEGSITGQFQIAYDDAIRGMREFQMLTGYRIGSSAAANWLTARAAALTLGSHSTVLTVFPSAAPDFEWRSVEAFG